MNALIDLKPQWLRDMVSLYGEPVHYRVPERGAPLRESWRWQVPGATVLVAVNYDPADTKILILVDGQRTTQVEALFPETGYRLGSDKAVPLLQAAGLLPTKVAAS